MKTFIFKNNKYTFDGNTCYLHINGKYGKFVAILDANDFEKVKNYSWSVIAGKYTYYVKTMVNRKTIRLHRLITACPNYMQVDHRNRNGLDNRRINLKLVTNGENQQNKRLLKNNTSGFNGVFWRKDRQRWVAYITINGKRIILGHKKTKEDAYKCRLEGEMIYFPNKKD